MEYNKLECEEMYEPIPLRQRNEPVSPYVGLEMEGLMLSSFPIATFEPIITTQTQTNEIKEDQQNETSADSNYIGTKEKRKTALPQVFVPSDYNVICAKGKFAYNPGNKHFRKKVESCLDV